MAPGGRTGVDMEGAVFPMARRSGDGDAARAVSRCGIHCAAPGTGAGEGDSGPFFSALRSAAAAPRPRSGLRGDHLHQIRLHPEPGLSAPADRLLGRAYLANEAEKVRDANVAASVRYRVRYTSDASISTASPVVRAVSRCADAPSGPRETPSGHARAASVPPPGGVRRWHHAPSPGR